MTDEEVIRRACELKGHAWRRTGSAISNNFGTHYCERCHYCGKQRWATPIEDPYTYSYPPEGKVAP